MTETMRAAQLVQPGKPLEIREVPIPEPGPGELLVKIEASGICHTDLHVRDGSAFPTGAPEPLTLGHEGIGRVVATGAGTRMALGRRIGIPWMHSACDHCRSCRTGRESFCASQLANGYNVHGTHAEYAIMNERFAVEIPDSINSAVAAPMMCAGVTAYGAVQLADLEPGRVCLILGCGGLGQFAIQLAKQFGATVIAVDSNPEKLALARRLGADQVLLPDDDAAAAIRSLGGADAALNFAPSAHIWPLVTQTLNQGSTFVSVAMVEEPVPLGLDWLTYNGVKITGASVGTRQQSADLMSIAAAANIRVPTETIRLDDINKGLERLANGQVEGRLVIAL